MDNELRRAYDVLRHLKKKVGANAFNEEYRIVMNEIKEALNGKSQDEQVASDEEESKAVNVVVESIQWTEVLKMCLPWLGAKELVKAACISKVTGPIVDEFVQTNSEHVCRVFKEDPRPLKALADMRPAVVMLPKEETEIAEIEPTTADGLTEVEREQARQIASL